MGQRQSRVLQVIHQLLVTGLRGQNGQLAPEPVEKVISRGKGPVMIHLQIMEGMTAKEKLLNHEVAMKISVSLHEY